MGRGNAADDERLVSTRNAIGFVSDIGGAAAALSMALAVIAGVAGTVGGLVGDRPEVVLFASGTVSGVALGAGCTLIMLVRKASSLEVQRGYRWVKATYTYRVSADDPHYHQQTGDIVIRAIRDGVRAFSNQYRWSGSGGDDGPIVTSPGHSLAGPIRQSVAWKTYDVHLDPALRKGETTTISVLQVLHDSGERFESFLAKSVHEPIQALTLRVELPLDLLPDRAWRITREGSGPQARVVDRHEVRVGDLVPRSRTDANATFEWQVPRPAVGRNYALHWSYVDDRGMYGVRQGPMSEEGQQAR
jgi:hypothetical protein